MQLSRPLNLSKFVENGGVAAKPLIINDTIYIGAIIMVLGVVLIALA